MAGVRDYPTVRYAKRGAVATVVLDRPECLNAYDRAMRDDLHAVFSAIDDDPEVRAVVLAGAGRAFSAGGDLREFGSAPSPVVARAVRFQRDVWGRLLGLRAATVAAVHGWTVGGGLEMALLCDVRIAAADARFALPETGTGMIPGVAGTQTLPRVLGAGRAMALTLAGTVVGARDAGRIGLVHRVVPRARLLATARTTARRLAGRSPREIQALRRCVRAAFDATLADGLALERRLALGLEPARP
jgi:enoyl-CoA hydratase